MSVGSAVAGVAGDRFGRRTALLGSMVIFGVATLAVSTAGSIAALIALRFLAGIGLGGAMPNAAALAAECVPRRHRPLAVTVTIVCVPLGGTIAGLAAIPLLPWLGWRALVVVGGVVPIVAALALRWLLPESPRYLARHAGRWPELKRTLRRMESPVPEGASFHVRQELPGASLGAIFQPDLRVDTFALWVSFFSCLLAVYLGFSWLPTIITGAQLGSSVATSGITLFNLGGVVGALAGGWLIARFGSKPTMLTFAAGAIAGAAMLSVTNVSSSSSVPILLTLLAITGGFLTAVQPTMFALAAHVYPTAMRATGVGTAVSVGRTGAILSGYAGPWALELHGASSFFALMTGAMTVTFAALATVRRHVRV